MKSILRIFIVMVLVYSAYSAYPYDYPLGIAFNAKTNSYYITNQTENGKYAACMSTVLSGGMIELRSDGKTTNYIMPLMTPSGIVNVNDTLYFLDICKVNISTAYNSSSVFAPNPYTKIQDQTNLQALCYDGGRNLYISSPNEIYKLNLDTKQYKIFNFGSNLNKPYGMTWDNSSKQLIIVSNIPNTPIKALNPLDSTLTTLKSTTLGLACGITQDGNGNFFVSDWGNSQNGSGKIYKFENEFQNDPIEIASGLSCPGLIYYNLLNDTIAIPNKSNSTITFISAGPHIPIVINVGTDNKPVSETPIFNWRNSGADSYQLQVALSSSIVDKNNDIPLADDFTNPVIDQSNIKDTFYLSTITLEQGKRYIWRVRATYGTNVSKWSSVLSFVPGQINDIKELPVENYFTISPNPTSDVISIKYSENIQLPENMNILILNTFGEIVSQCKLMSENRIDISGLASGIYFVKLGDKVNKFIKL